MSDCNPEKIIKEIELQLQKQAQVQAQIQKQLQEQAQLQAQIQKQLQEQVQLQAQIQKQLQEQLQEQAQVQTDTDEDTDTITFGDIGNNQVTVTVDNTAIAALVLIILGYTDGQIDGATLKEYVNKLVKTNND